MRIIAEGGLESLTMSALGRALGASTAGLYRYFPSKESILVALQEQAIDGYEADLEASLTAVVDPLERVLIAFGQYARHAEERPARHRLIDTFLSAPTPLLSDERAWYINTMLDRLIRRCAGVLEEAENAGLIEPGDNTQRTVVLWGALHGLDHFRKRDRIQPSPLQSRALVPAFLESILRGFGASPQKIHDAKQNA